MQRCSKNIDLFGLRNIKKAVALIMLVVFAISTTPTIVFHNLFAGHTDSVNNSRDNDNAQISSPVFNCHCDHIVAESPFTDLAQYLNCAKLTAHSVYEEALQAALKSSPDIFYPLRGPPAV